MPSDITSRISICVSIRTAHVIEARIPRLERLGGARWQRGLEQIARGRLLRRDLLRSVQPRASHGESELQTGQFTHMESTRPSRCESLHTTIHIIGTQQHRTYASFFRFRFRLTASPLFPAAAAAPPVLVSSSGAASLSSSSSSSSSSPSRTSPSPSSSSSSSSSLWLRKTVRDVCFAAESC